MSIAIIILVQIVSVIPTVLVPALGQPGALYQFVAGAIDTLVLLIIPLAIAGSLLCYRLWDIDALINKALVYGLLAGLLGALYAGMIIGLTSLAGHVSGAADRPIVLVIATLAIAALFQPVRTRIQSLIDRRFYRRKYDAEQTLSAFYYYGTPLIHGLYLGDILGGVVIAVAVLALASARFVRKDIGR